VLAHSTTIQTVTVFSVFAMEDYDVFKELGDGSFGTVIQAKHKHTGQMVRSILRSCWNSVLSMHTYKY